MPVPRQTLWPFSPVAVLMNYAPPVKFDGHLGRYTRSHKKFASKGTSRHLRHRMPPAAAASLATAQLTAALRNGLDTRLRAEFDACDLAALQFASDWFPGEDALPLHSTVVRASEAFRLAVPRGHSIPRKVKKAHKKRLQASLEEFAAALAIVEWHVAQTSALGRRLK